MQKKAIITVKLIAESIVQSNDTIADEIRRWLEEDAVPAPWVKEILNISVRNS